jgi:hypothetical protein
MSAGADLVTCPLCGTSYNQSDGRACRSGCPLSSNCELLSCPSCGYEMPGPTRLTRWLSGWFGGGRRAGAER